MNRLPVRGAYTLIELIVVMGLIILLTASAITGIIRSQRIFTFNAADQQVGSLVREARSLAVTGKSIIDYTDYDQDDCKNAGNHGPSCTMAATEDDKVTPAHYGVHFDTAANTITLFADMHLSGTEGVYDGTPAGFGEYNIMGTEDIKIAEYELVPTLDLLAIGQNTASGTTTPTNTVMYSPIFADTAFSNDAVSVDLMTGNQFFVFGIRENTGPALRDRCFAIHPISGVPETTNATGESCP